MDKVTEFESALTPEAYKAAWRYAWRLADCREDAEDLLQESLVNALRAFHQLRDPSNFKAWLLSIVRRNHQAHLRRRQSGINALTGQLSGDGEQWADISNTDSKDPIAEDLAAAMARLPGSQREILALFYFEGLSLKELAGVLGTSPNAATLVFKVSSPVSIPTISATLAATPKSFFELDCQSWIWS